MELDPIRRKILEWLDERPDVTMKEVSLAIRRSHSYLQQFLGRGTPRELKERDRIAIARFFGKPETELRPPSDVLTGPSPQTEDFNRLSTFEPHPIPNHLRGTHTKDLPVWSAKVASAIGRIELTESNDEMTYRPGRLVNVRNAYALYVPDDAMAPRYKQGEIICVNPNRAPPVGECGVINLIQEPGQPKLALIAEIVRRTSGKLFVIQYKVHGTQEIPLSAIESTHWIVSSGPA